MVPIVRNLDRFAPIEDDERAMRTLWVKIVRRIHGIDPDGETAGADISLMASAVAKLVNAKCAKDKVDIEKSRTTGDDQKFIDIAKEQLKAEIRKIVGVSPTLAQQLCEVVESASENAAQQETVN